MGFRKETADLSAILKAGMKKGLNAAQLQAIMAAAIENGVKDPIAAASEMLSKLEPVVKQQMAAPVAETGRFEQDARQSDVGLPERSERNNKRFVFGLLALISLGGIVLAFGPQVPRAKPQNDASSLVTKSETGGAQIAASKETPAAPVVMDTPEEQLTERIETYWLPEVKQWPARVTGDAASFADATAKMDLFQSYLADRPGMSLNAEQTKVVRSYTNALGAKQASILPEMRKQYSRQMDEALFRHDIRVTVHGSGNRTLRLTGSIFVRNANIEDTQSTMLEPARKLRFSRIEYRWSPRVSETIYYDLDTPADDKVE